MVNDQLRIAVDVESCSAELDGDAQPIDEGLVFHGVVWGREMEADGVAKPTPVQGD